MLTKPSNIICNLMINFLFINLISLTSATVKHQNDCHKKQPKLSNTNYENLQINGNKTKRELAESYSPTTDYYQCPGISYPDDYQLCCGINECCKAELNFILYPITDYNLPYAILIAVLLACFFVLLVLTLCCFWSICPLYNSCRIRYYRDEASCTDKMGEIVNTDAMPGEPVSNTLVIAKHFDSDAIEERKFINNKQNLIESTKIAKSDEFSV